MDILSLSGCDLNPVSIWVENHAFIVAVAGAARAIQDGVSIHLDSPGDLLDELLRTYRDGEVCEAHALGAGLRGFGIQPGCFHDFEARPISEADELGLEAFGRVGVAGRNSGAEVSRVELRQAVEIIRPDCDVFDMHSKSPVLKSRAPLVGHAKWSRGVSGFRL